MPAITAEQLHQIVTAALDSAMESSERQTAVHPSWASAAGLLAVQSVSNDNVETQQRVRLVRRSADAALVGRTAEQIVYNFLSDGELREFGGHRASMDSTGW